MLTRPVLLPAFVSVAFAKLSTIASTILYELPYLILPSAVRITSLPRLNDLSLSVLLRIFLTFNLQPGRLEKLIGKLAG